MPFTAATVMGLLPSTQLPGPATLLIVTFPVYVKQRLLFISTTSAVILLILIPSEGRVDGFAVIFNMYGVPATDVTTVVPAVNTPEFAVTVLIPEANELRNRIVAVPPLALIGFVPSRLPLPDNENNIESFAFATMLLFESRTVAVSILVSAPFAVMLAGLAATVTFDAPPETTFTVTAAGVKLTAPLFVDTVSATVPLAVPLLIVIAA